MTDAEKAMLTPEFSYTPLADIEIAIRTGNTERPELQGLDKGKLEILKSAKLKTIVARGKNQSTQFNAKLPENTKDLSKKVNDFLKKYPEKVEKLIETLATGDKAAFEALKINKNSSIYKDVVAGKVDSIKEILDLLLCAKFKGEKQKELEEKLAAEQAARGEEKGKGPKGEDQPGE